MNRVIKREDVGKFGEMIAGEEEYKKTLHGKVLYVDHFGTVIFVDNDDIAHRFPRTVIVSFEEKEFQDNTQ